VLYGNAVRPVAPEPRSPLNPLRLNRELTIVSSFINPYTFTRSVRLLGQKRVVMDDIITDIVPLEEIGRVFTDPAFRKRGKVLIRMGD
jgi:threonine dehydrogenase-like Zn-dependent dehydrogenase